MALKKVTRSFSEKIPEGSSDVKIKNQTYTLKDESKEDSSENGFREVKMKNTTYNYLDDTYVINPKKDLVMEKFCSEKDESDDIEVIKKK